MSEGASIGFHLKNAFDFEIRNRIDIRIKQLNDLEELNEKQTDELQTLEIVREYLLKRIGELKT